MAAAFVFTQHRGFGSMASHGGLEISGSHGSEVGGLFYGSGGSFLWLGAFTDAREKLGA
jgi:hypothetical protein